MFDFNAASHSKLLLSIDVIQIILYHAFIGVAAAKIFTRTGNLNRMDITVLGFAAKSLIIKAYILSTEHVRRFKRFASLKAYMILDIIEVVFWSAAVVLIAMNLGACTPLTCALGGAGIGIAVVIALLGAFVAYVSVSTFRHRDDYALDQYVSRVPMAYTISKSQK